MKYIRLNEDLTTATDLVRGKAYVSYNNTSYESQFLRLKPVAVGDIIYWNGSSLSSIAYTDWDSSLGTPEAVVFAPASHMPDGKARGVCLTGVGTDGSQSTSMVSMVYNSINVDAGLTKYTKVPTWSNTEGSTYGSNNYGYLPSSKFTSNICYSDSSAGYCSTSNIIPSLYLNDGTVNENARMTIDGGNVLTDFDGKTNTSTIINNLGSTAAAANACNKYATDHILAGEWYLPAAGELAYLMTRWNTIKAALAAVNRVALLESNRYWSSSEYSLGCAWLLFSVNGYLGWDGKDDPYRYVRAVCQLA